MQPSLPPGNKIYCNFRHGPPAFAGTLLTSSALQVCGAAGALSVLVWAGWALTLARKQQHPGHNLLLAFLLTTNAAVLLEVFDFPPLLGPKVGATPWKTGHKQLFKALFKPPNHLREADTS